MEVSRLVARGEHTRLRRLDDVLEVLDLLLRRQLVVDRLREDGVERFVLV